jgi:DNA helicase IV
MRQLIFLAYFPALQTQTLKRSFPYFQSNKVGNILNDLNPIQQEAVRQTSGPMLVIAGAGSGKPGFLLSK